MGYPRNERKVVRSLVNAHEKTGKNRALQLYETL